MSGAERLFGIVRETPWLMDALRAARALDLPDGWIVAGAVYGTVWNAMTWRDSRTGIKDIDLIYFDPDPSWEAEDAVIRDAAKLFAPDPPVEIRNQARVHVWFKDRFGFPIPPFRDSADAIRHYASKTHCVGLRLRADDGFDLVAPYGLEAVFAMRLEPNPVLPNRATYEAKAARQRETWPELTVRPWPVGDEGP